MSTPEQTTILLFSARIHDALEIHRPCHTDATEPYGCAYHYGDPLGLEGDPLPYEPAQCMCCTYDDRIITYPCETAQALGVPAPEPTQET